MNAPVWSTRTAELPPTADDDDDEKEESHCAEVACAKQFVLIALIKNSCLMAAIAAAPNRHSQAATLYDMLIGFVGEKLSSQNLEHELTMFDRFS